MQGKGVQGNKIQDAGHSTSCLTHNSVKLERALSCAGTVPVSVLQSNLLHWQH